VIVATVLILGGGIGGLVAAKRLRRALPRPHRVVLVEREASFVFAPSLTWLMTGDRTMRSISRPLERLVPGGIELIRGEIERIDPERRRVTVSGTAHDGDHLVIALGAELAPEQVPGLAGAGCNVYTAAGAGQLRDALARFEGGRIVVLTATPAYKCPAAPYESALLLESHLRRRGLRGRTEIALYAAEAAPMATAGPEVAKGVRQMIESKGIAYHPEHQVVAADGAARALRFANGATADFDLLAFVPPHRAPRVVRESGLAPEGGWMVTDRRTLRTSQHRVHAIGDVTSIPLASGRPLPKAGVFAHRQAEVVAHNITREILGRGRLHTFDGVGECFIEAGDGRAGVGRGDFYAEPAPRVALFAPARRWHLAKVMIEKAWLLGWY
jgi:sulfide:quinone oxidoreductase